MHATSICKNAGNLKGVEEFHSAKDRLWYSSSYIRSKGKCDDALMVYSGCDRREQGFIVGGVFDGVSGWPGSSGLTSFISQHIIDFLSDLPDARRPASTLCEIVHACRQGAGRRFQDGNSTISMLFLNEDGEYALIGCGDSPAYIRENGLWKLALPLDLPLVEDGCTLEEYLEARRYVSNCLLDPEFAPHILSGRISGDTAFMLITDGLSDNLSIIVDDLGNVVDSSGVADLDELMGTSDPKQIAKIAADIYKERISRWGNILHFFTDSRCVEGKVDDVSVVAVSAIRFGGGI